MTAEQETRELMARLSNRGIPLDFDQANVLRRAERTLHRWNELECGDGNEFASWTIERSEETGIPYLVTYPHKKESHRHRIPDREAGVKRRIEKLAKEKGLFVYYQTDPRGCALYVSPEPFNANDYTRGIAI